MPSSVRLNCPSPTVHCGFRICPSRWYIAGYVRPRKYRRGIRNVSYQASESRWRVKGSSNMRFVSRISRLYETGAWPRRRRPEFPMLALSLLGIAVAPAGNRASLHAWEDVVVVTSVIGDSVAAFGEEEMVLKIPMLTRCNTLASSIPHTGAARCCRTRARCRPSVGHGSSTIPCIAGSAVSSHDARPATCRAAHLKRRQND